MFLNTDHLRDEEIFLNLTKTCDAQVEKGYVPAYKFDICLLDGRKIGLCDLRVGHNDNTKIGGNIGYMIEEEYRGNHYAAKACRLLFKLSKAHEMDHLIITCDPTNHASARTIELAGGSFIETCDIPESHEMREKGRHKVKIYRVELGKDFYTED